MAVHTARFVSLHDALAVPKIERGSDSALTPRVTPFPALELGPLLGRGSYGRVYRGKHLGRPVAVKVGALCAGGSPVILLRGLSIQMGPLLGRGSYGRV